MTFHKNDTKADLKYEVKEEVAALKPRNNGDVVRLRYLSWNGRDPKYDLRIWKVDDDGNEVAGKGIGLSGEELEELAKLLNE